jgi:ribosomal-protein-alanine N-acetyltransferase
MPSVQTDPDPAELAAVDAACFPDAWDAGEYAVLLNNAVVCGWLLRDAAGAAVGLLCFQHAWDEVELYRIAVLPARRGHGLGAWLLARLLDWARAEGMARVHLDVRAGNGPARRLYERAGFREVGRRRAYYLDPVEDAVLYAWEPTQAAGG